MPRRDNSPLLFERLAAQKKRLQAEATQTEPSPARDKRLDKIRQLDVAVQVNAWLSSPGLQVPR